MIKNVGEPLAGSITYLPAANMRPEITRVYMRRVASGKQFTIHPFVHECRRSRRRRHHRRASRAPRPTASASVWIAVDGPVCFCGRSHRRLTGSQSERRHREAATKTL
jgi:hypothetical protein